MEIWDSITGSKRQTLRVKASTMESLTFSPDGKTLLVGYLEGTAELWDVRAGTRLHELAPACTSWHPKEMMCMRSSPVTASAS